MKIHRIQIRNFRGISTLDQSVPDAGTIVSGANGRGKTSFLKAIRAALAAQDCGSDAIRIGEDSAEILVDIDALTVRRSITAKGNSVKVTTRDGMQAPKPQTFLAELLGTSPFDPLDLLLAKKSDRRAKVLEALPITVTLEQLRQWAPGVDADVSGHGLEVVARARDGFYAARTDANKVAKAAVAEAERLMNELGVLAAAAPAKAEPVADAEAKLASARAEVSRLEAQNAEAAKAAARGAEARAKAEEFEASATELAGKAERVRPSAGDLSLAGAAVADAKAAVAAKERELADAKARLLAACDALSGLEQNAQLARHFDADAENARKYAADYQRALDSFSVAAVDPEVMRIAVVAFASAEGIVAASRAHAKIAEATARTEAAAETAKRAAAEAARLDGIVKALSDDAPAALLASAKGIPGLGLSGDDVTLDGKKLDALCGAEAAKFCVDIAKRLNAKSKILIVDGLERIDPDAREDFVRFATADGWQLLASCVDRGAPVFAAIEADDAVQAAE